MLQTVEIKNFRSCYSTRLDFDGSVSAISGRNGVGKTNILRAIDWASKSVILADGVKMDAVGIPAEKPSDLSIGFRLRLAGQTYDYQFSAPRRWRRLRLSSSPPVGLQEALAIVGEDGSETPVFNRKHDTITVAGRTEEIRIPQWTPALAALFSLLSPRDPHHDHIGRLVSFFGGVGYYPLHDGSDTSDSVTAQEYENWELRHRDEGELTHSVAFRLIHMWREDKELLKELLFILGRDGLDVVDEIDVLPVKQSTTGRSANDTAASNITAFWPIYKPSQRMGGSGSFFSFSGLSAGTRRIIQIIASMLFDRRSLMMLEHPEDSIHPGLLRKLIDQIRVYSYSTQMLLTTHSLEVLDILRPEEILLATATDGATSVRALTPDEIQRAKEFLQDEGALSDFLEMVDGV